MGNGNVYTREGGAIPFIQKQKANEGWKLFLTSADIVTQAN